jgi:hypothetical protein
VPLADETDDIQCDDDEKSNADDSSERDTRA